MKTAGRLLVLALAVGGVLFAATPCAAVAPCKFDGLRCRTNDDCCSGVCTASVCAAPHCQAFPATGQTSSFHTDDDGAIQAGAPLSYTDNGDGTITDNNTGLVWEKLSMDRSIHDVRNNGTWGQAFFRVEALNSMNFAGHNDWRVPNVKELLSIVNYGTFNPAVSAAFYTNCTEGCTPTSCSCTADSSTELAVALPSVYWSSTTDASAPAEKAFPGNAWSVYFRSGFLGANVKENNYFLRAVRGGRISTLADRIAR
jgi:hypothetical protein